MAVALYEEHGLKTFQLQGERLVRRLEGLDTVTQDWQTEDRFSFSPSGVMPGIPGMTIIDVETEEDGPVFLHRLQGEGVVGTKPEKRIAWKTRESLQGWDGAQAVWITKTPSASKFDRGSSPTGFAALYAMDVEKEELRHGYYKVSLDYAGLVGTKPYQRRVTVNEQVISGDSMVVGLDPAWTTPRRGEVSLPKVVVMDTEIVTSQPDTTAIPGNATPPDTPSIQVISVTGSDLLWHWPYGWKLASIDYEKIPGKNLWLVTWVYEYVWRLTP